MTLDFSTGLALGLGLGLLLLYLAFRRATGAPERRPAEELPPQLGQLLQGLQSSDEDEEDNAEDDEAALSGAPDASTTNQELVLSASTRLHALAAQLYGDYNEVASPDDMLTHPGFVAGVQLLTGEDFEEDELLAYLRGDNMLISTLSAIALGERERAEDAPSLLGPLLSSMREINPYARSFVLRALEMRQPSPLLGPVLAVTDEVWHSPFLRRTLQQFCVRRLREGDDQVDAELFASMSGEQLEWVERMLRDLQVETAAAEQVADALLGLLDGRLDMEFFKEVGRLWDGSEGDGLLEDPLFVERRDEIVRKLTGGMANSLALVGDSGVGKSSVIRMAAKELIAGGWRIFDASATELMAGQSFIGELEGRIQKLLANVAGKPRMLWHVRDFEDLVLAGRHRFSTVSILDMVLPAIESGELRILAELSPESWQRVLQNKPALRTAIEAMRVAPLGEPETLDMARRWSERFAEERDTPLVAEPLLLQSLQLSEQFLGELAQPGKLLSLLQATHADLRSETSGEIESIGREHLLRTLGRLTGLSRVILDENEALDLDEAERYFHERVVGQPEAVACLLDCVAMLKAGLNDGSRPQGVFLFTGPTGTGKTELARTLASFLFGSERRLVRFDMSEFQDLSSMDRLLGEGEEGGRKRALVDEIREEPFSVVLLDEFEKAHPVVHDLFLQVFDDGRLTDRRGRVADFRHAIVIMTSNVGAGATHGAQMGFGEAPSATGLESGVDKALRQIFRAEFLNRIDQIVVFRQLGRAALHRILEKELAQILERRGLRNRQWAVEWDPSALEFFLDRGFSPEFGARPLRRSIERHLLAPLARTIVHRQAPSGDQFLFIRSDGRGVQVVFVDPDAQEENAPHGESSDVPRGAAAKASSVQQVALEARGDEGELQCLREAYEELRLFIQGEVWLAARAEAMARMSEPEFWSRPDRFAVLGEIEYRDRIEHGFETATRLERRLDSGARDRFPTELLTRFASQLHLLQAALRGLKENAPVDAYLRVEALQDPRPGSIEPDGFAQQIAAMYRSWGERRRMQVETLLELGLDAPVPYQLILAVGGFGAFTLLRSEAGLHVLELPEGEGSLARRVRVRVTVAGQADQAPAEDRRQALKQARDALDAVALDPALIARRYRQQPSPLIRDAARGWRSGRWSLVLGGDFDLIEGD
jgi:ATP-dependent Clp protease ATP-binding subunit ClpC